MVSIDAPLKVTDDRYAVLLDARQEQQRLEDQIVNLYKTLQIVGVALESVHRLEDHQNPSVAVHVWHNVAAVGAVEELAVMLDGMPGHPGGVASLEVIVGMDRLVGLDRVPARIVQELGQQRVLRAHSQLVAL